MAHSVWKGFISFGLLNIPVALYPSRQDKELHFSYVDKKDMSPIKYQKISSHSGRVVPWDRIVKGYEYEKNKYVIMTDKDFKAANVKATQSIDIEDFVPIEDVDPLLFEKPYYIVPQKKAEKSYFLLHKALMNTKKAAIAKVVLRTKQHLAALMPRGDYLILEMLHFAHEIKEVTEVDYLEDANRKIHFSPRELKMAETLIDDMTVKWHPEKYKDTYYDDLMKRIRLKIRKGADVEIEESELVPEETAQVIDLMPLLKKSLEQHHRPKRARKSSRSSGRHPRAK